MAVPRCAWGRSRRTPVPTPHSEGQPPRLATPAVGPLRHLERAVHITGLQRLRSNELLVKAAKDILICGSYKKLRTPETQHRPAERTFVTRWTTERVAPGAHAIILIDRAGWYVPTKLVGPKQHHAR